MSNEMLTTVLIVSVLGAISLPYVIAACFWPVLKSTKPVRWAVGSKRRPHRWTTRKMLFYMLKSTARFLAASPLLYWAVACKAVRLLDKLSRQKPGDLAPVLVWIVLGALLFKPLFGNPFSQDGWSNAFSDPAGFVVFATIALASLILIISANRAGLLGISEKWKRAALRCTIALMVFGAVAYFLFFAIQAHNPKTDSANPAPPAPAATTPAPKAAAPEVTAAALTGREREGTKLADLAPGKSARVSWTGGNVCVKGSRRGQDTLCLALSGFPDSDIANYGEGRMWAPNFRYTEPGIKAGETLVVLGAVGGGEEEVYEFIKGESTLTVKNSSDETLPLSAYLNLVGQYWISHDGYVFPSQEMAKRLGRPNAQYEEGFGQKYYLGSSSFRAEILP